MSRIRSIKPEFFSDEKLARVSREARLLFIGLWTVTCDDYGVSRAHPGVLKQVFPFDEDLNPGRIGQLVDELEREGFIRRFEAEGERYLQVWNWTRHQRVDHPGKVRNPPPPEGLQRLSRESSETLAMDLGARTIGPRTVGPLSAPPERQAALKVLTVEATPDDPPAEREDWRRLVEDCVASFETVVSSKYSFTGRDAKALSNMLKRGIPHDVVLGTWRWALQHMTHPPVRSLVKLDLNWNDIHGQALSHRPGTRTVNGYDKVDRPRSR